MATYTENLNLAKPDVNDQVDIQVLNNNFDKLDEVVSSNVLQGTYSEEEIVVGKWIDGRPIYRRVVLATNVQITTSSSMTALPSPLYPSNLNEIELITNAGLVCYGDGQFQGYCYLTLYGSDGQLVYKTGESWLAKTNRTIGIIYEYIKTTDLPQ